MSKTPEQVLKEAAVAADALLPKLEEERYAALKKLNEIEQSISLLRAITTSSATITTNSFSFSGPPAPDRRGIGLADIRTHSLGIGMAEPARTVLSPDLSLMDKIKVVLKIHGGLMPRQISEEIKNLYGEEPAPSSLYAALNRGKMRGTLLDNDGLWNVKK